MAWTGFRGQRLEYLMWRMRCSWMNWGMSIRSSTSSCGEASFGCGWRRIGMCTFVGEALPFRVMHGVRLTRHIPGHRFPIESPEVEGDEEVPPVHSEAAAADRRSLSRIENVPLEILFRIAFHLELPSLLSFATTSRSIRRSLLGDRSARNAVGKALIERHLPHLLPAPPGEAKPSAPAGAWSYLRRCLESPSMRNRRRIWAIAQRLEMMADRLGFWCFIPP